MNKYALPMSVKFGNNNELFIETSNKPPDMLFNEIISEEEEYKVDSSLMVDSDWNVTTIKKEYDKQNYEFKSIVNQFAVKGKFIDNNNVCISRDQTMSNPVKCTYKYQKIREGDFTTYRITFKFISHLPDENFILGLFDYDDDNIELYHNLKSTPFYLFNLTTICNHFTTTFDKNKKDEILKVLYRYKYVLDDECSKKITDYITGIIDEHGGLSHDVGSLIASFFKSKRSKNGRSKNKRSKNRRTGTEPRKRSKNTRSNRKRSKAV